MKKIVKLTEADLYRIVNRVLNEQPQTGQTQNLTGTTKTGQTQNLTGTTKTNSTPVRRITDYSGDPLQGKPNPFRPKPGQQPNMPKMSSMKENEDDDYDMLPEMPSEIYKEYIDKVINNVVKLFETDLENGHITGTYDIDVFVDKMEYDLNKLFMDFMEEENLSEQTVNELNEYANYKVEKTVDHFYNTVEGMDSPEQFEDDSNPLNLPHIDTWHDAQYKAQDGKTEEAIKLITKAADEAEKYAKENQDGGVAGEAGYYRGTIAWLKKDYTTVEKYINDKFVKFTGNDEVLKRLLKNKDKSYKEAYNLKEASDPQLGVFYWTLYRTDR